MSDNLGTKFILALIISVPFIIGWGVFVMLGWNWWVADTFSIPELTIGPAVGITFVYNQLHATPSDKTLRESFITAAVHITLAFFGLWIIGLVVG